MRLIDADALLEHIKRLECHAHNLKYEQGLNDCLQCYFPQIIENQPSGCNHKRFSDLHSFEFCPYCGKKIKVAPYQPKGE